MNEVSKYQATEPDLSSAAPSAPAVGYAMAGPPPPAPAPSRRSSRRSHGGVVVGAGTVAVAVVVAVVAAGVFGTKSAQATVISSINSTLADHSADLTFSMTGSEAGTSFQSTGSGAIDFAHNALQMQVNVTGNAQAQSVHIEYLGKTLYEQVPGISAVVPGKSWVSLDLAEISAASASGTGSLGSTSNPIAMLHLLAQNGGTVVATGPSNIGGVAVQGYAVTLSHGALTRDLSQASLPSWMRQAVANVNLDNLRCDVAIDSAGLLRQVKLAMSLQVASETAAVSETLDFSHYGASASIVAPPSNEVVGYQQFLQAAEGHAGT